MKSDDLQIRRESLRILGLTNDKKVIKLLLISLEESEERALLEEAVLSLTRFLEENEVFYSLVKKLKDKSLDKEVRITILSVLSTSSQAEEVFPYLINIIIDRDDDLKLDAIKVIAEKRDAKNVETLLKKVFDKIIK